MNPIPLVSLAILFFYYTVLIKLCAGSLMYFLLHYWSSSYTNFIQRHRENTNMFGLGDRAALVHFFFLSPSFPMSSCSKLILILNVCSGSRSGQVRDCLLFMPSGHLKLHLIQMPICSTQIGSGCSWLPGWLPCLAVLCTSSTKVCTYLHAHIQ